MLGIFVDIGNEIDDVEKEAEMLSGALKLYQDSSDGQDQVWTWLTTRGLAFGIEKIYTGCEHIMAMIASEIDGARIDHYEGWHIALLKRMAHPFPRVREAVISDECCRKLDRLRSFRQERSSFGLAPDADMISGKVTEALQAFEQFRIELEAFANRFNSPTPDGGIMAPPKYGAMSADSFLDWISHQVERHELVDGEPVRMMAGVGQSHNVVTSNILVALASGAKSKGCRTTSSDTAVRTGPYGIRYPEIVVDCGPPDPSARQAAQPILVVEVASPDASAVDLTDRLDEYQRHDDIQVIVLVEPDIVLMRVYRRDVHGPWNVERYDDLTEIIDLPEIGSSISLADVYDTLSPAIRPRPRVVDEPESGGPGF